MFSLMRLFEANQVEAGAPPFESAESNRRALPEGLEGSLPGPVSSGELLNAGNHSLVAGPSGHADRNSAWSREGTSPQPRPRKLRHEEQLATLAEYGP